jgi:hypothetical protein
MRRMCTNTGGLVISDRYKAEVIAKFLLPGFARGNLLLECMKLVSCYWMLHEGTRK